MTFNMLQKPKKRPLKQERHCSCSTQQKSTVPNKIRISSNLKYISIQFNTSMVMETFCTNPLKVKNFSISLKPDFSKRQTRYYKPETISFKNVPAEADEDSMTPFVQQYAVVIGKPRYPIETINDIDYLTGTRIYKVHSRKEHIPRTNKIFGRQTQCI